MLENGIQGIFYLGCKKMGEPLRVRNLTKQEDCQVKIATINSEAIKVKAIHFRVYGQTLHTNFYILLMMMMNDSVFKRIKFNIILTIASFTKYSNSNGITTIWISRLDGTSLVDELQRSKASPPNECTTKDSTNIKISLSRIH
jgi:hypothetical protein